MREEQILHMFLAATFETDITTPATAKMLRYQHVKQSSPIRLM